MLPIGQKAEIDADAVRTSTKTRRGKASAIMDEFTSRLYLFFDPGEPSQTRIQPLDDCT